MTMHKLSILGPNSALMRNFTIFFLFLFFWKIDIEESEEWIK